MAIGCTGFFVNPTLTSLTVGPQATINQGQTVQESAVGTYNDGSTKTLGSGVFWSSSDAGVASVNTGGLVSGVSPGTSTITASSGAVTGSATVTVSLNVSSITVTPKDASIAQGDSEQYTAMGSYNGQQIDVSDIVTWSISNTENDAWSIDSTGLVTTTSGTITATTQITVTATAANGVSGSTNLTVTVQ